MRRTSSPVSLLALALGGALLMFGCKQGHNDRCEVDNDCQTGFVCSGVEKAPYAGTCKTPAEAMSSSRTAADAAVEPPPLTPSDGAAASDATPAGDTPASPAVDGATDSTTDATADLAADVGPALDGSSAN